VVRLERWFEQLCFAFQAILCHVSLFSAIVTCTSCHVIWFLHVSSMSAKYIAWFVYVHEDGLVISVDGSLVSHVPGLVLWLKSPWRQRLVTSNPLELGVIWELDGLPVLILSYLSLCCHDIPFYGVRLGISMEYGILEFVFDAHSE